MLRVEGLSEMGVAVPQASARGEVLAHSKNGRMHDGLTRPERAYVRSRTAKEMSQAGYEVPDAQLSARNLPGYLFVDYPANLAAEMLERVWRVVKSN
jgi:hypothetical protein